MKKLKIKKKVLKGMTLMEIIIAIAIVAVMTSILVGTANAINVYLRSANDINDRVALQAPVAQSKDIHGAGIAADDGIEIVLTPDIDDAESISLVGDIYSVFDAHRMDEHKDEFGHGLNLKYIDGIKSKSEGDESPDDDDDAEGDEGESGDPSDDDEATPDDDPLDEATPDEDTPE